MLEPHALAVKTTPAIETRLLGPLCNPAPELIVSVSSPVHLSGDGDARLAKHMRDLRFAQA